MTKANHPHAGERVVKAASKIGVQPHELSSDDVLKALSEGKITVEECESLMDYVARVENMVGKTGTDESFKNTAFGD